MKRSVQFQLLFGLIVAVAVIGAALALNRNNARIDRQATALRDEAKESFSADSTADDVRRWLQEQQWHILTDPNGQWMTGYYEKDAGLLASPEYLVVRGYKELGLDDWVPISRWISLTFRFNPDRTFQSVFLDRHAPQPPGYRRPKG